MARTITQTGFQIKAGADTGFEQWIETVAERNYTLLNAARLTFLATTGGVTQLVASHFVETTPKVRFIHIENHDGTSKVTVAIRKADASNVLEFDLEPGGTFTWRGQLKAADGEILDLVFTAIAGTPQISLVMASGSS